MQIFKLNKNKCKMIPFISIGLHYMTYNLNLQNHIDFLEKDFFWQTSNLCCLGDKGKFQNARPFLIHNSNAIRHKSMNSITDIFMWSLTIGKSMVMPTFKYITGLFNLKHHIFAHYLVYTSLYKELQVSN